MLLTYLFTYLKILTIAISLYLIILENVLCLDMYNFDHCSLYIKLRYSL